MPRRNPAAFLGFTFLEFSQVKCVLGSQVKCDAANRSLIPNTFLRKTRLAGGIPQGHCHCNFSFVPKPGRRPNVDKGALQVSKGDVGLFHFQFLTKRGSLLSEKAMLGYVTHNSSKRVSLRTKRLGCQRWHATACLSEA